LRVSDVPRLGVSDACGRVPAADTEQQLDKLPDLYLQGDFQKEMLMERKARLERTVGDLTPERAELTAHVQTEILTDVQIAEIEAFCAEVRESFDTATFEDKKRYFELLDVRGKLAVEDGEKVIHVRCKLGKQRRWHIPTSPLSSIGETETTLCVCQLILHFR
jgi:hypothetical protein